MQHQAHDLADAPALIGFERGHDPHAAWTNVHSALGLVVIEPQRPSSLEYDCATQHQHGSSKGGMLPTAHWPIAAPAPRRAAGVNCSQPSALKPLKVTMNLFNQLPGFVRSPPGLEQRIRRRLPAVLLWGTLLPLLLVGAVHVLAPASPVSGGSHSALLLWNYAIYGLVVLHWTLVLTVALGCFIVRVMKGPAYVADAYPLPDDKEGSTTRP